MTQNILIMAYYDRLRETMAQNLVNHFILTQNNIVWLFIFLNLVSKIPFFVLNETRYKR